ncbi:unnamed protein product [Miscanthus lutarioriparius]|uniref:Uncharacterized protein n=1 Tax=Miscanthus lutarioriparius TaxID=422564 RepID=A0A811PI83_9POAL|nr:unnamed protein product [Miscanthus lutarioriparius]
MVAGGSFFQNDERQGRSMLSNNSNNSDVKVTYIDDLVAAPVLAELLRREYAGLDVATRRAVLRLSAVVPAVTALGPRREVLHHGRAWWMRWSLRGRDESRLPRVVPEAAAPGPSRGCDEPRQGRACGLRWPLQEHARKLRCPSQFVVGPSYCTVRTNNCAMGLTGHRCNVVSMQEDSVPLPPPSRGHAPATSTPIPFTAAAAK